jgi:hypothetical protein
MIPCIAFGQNMNKTGVGISTGFAHNRMINEGLNYNKLLLTGTTFKLNLNYFNESEKRQINSEFDINTGTVNHALGNLPTEFNILTLNFEYLKNFGDNNFLHKKGKLFAGLALTSKNFLFENDEFLDNVDLLFNHGLNFKMKEIIDISPKKTLSIGLRLPIISYAKREATNGGINRILGNENADYAKLIFARGKISYIPQFEFNIDYQKKLSEKVNFKIDYRFNYLHNSLNEKLNFYNNELMIGFKFYFKK